MNFLEKEFFFFENFMIDSIFEQGWQEHNVTMMIFVLVVVVLDRFFRILKVLHQLLYPFCDYSQHCVGFYKENAVCYFLLGVERSVFGDLSTD